MKVSEMQGFALDWAVAKCGGLLEAGHVVVDFEYMSGHDPVRLNPLPEVYYSPAYTPSTNWAQGGPIIEREEIALEPMTHDEHGDGWLATRVEGPAICMEFGQTMLIAAMRCFVASHLGDEVDVPEELK